MSLHTRQLGRDGPRVPAVGFGAMSLGEHAPYSGGTTALEDRLKVLDRAWELGQRFWDTADVYSGGEACIGEWFRTRPGKRADIFLATKFGLAYSPQWEETIRSDAEYVRAACEGSLARLGVDAIDLLYCHRVDGKTPIEHTVAAMAELKREGKVRHLGLSEVSAATIRRAHAVHPIAAVQVEYSPFCLDIESPTVGVMQTCRELGIAVVASSPMGRGLLTGTVPSFDELPADDMFRRNTAKYAPDNFPKIMELVSKLRTVAEARSPPCTPAQVTIAWILAQGEDVIPIPGTRSIKYLEENTAAAHVELTDEEVAGLRRAAEATELTGDRYPSM
jgi:aryl-alcohol dehydrogenase-like predicted oxidoreductase